MKSEVATLAGGCFWCTEAIYKRLKGIKSVAPGYSGGTVENPTYEQVSSGNTGHAEAIQIVFDPDVIPYRKILDVFWHTHNPTTPNQQGPDHGPQYRSIIFYHNEQQRKEAEESKTVFENEGVYKEKIITEVLPFVSFYVAEDYHQNFYERHKFNPYCTFIINPKIKKLIEHYSQDIKPEYLA